LSWSWRDFPCRFRTSQLFHFAASQLPAGLSLWVILRKALVASVQQIAFRDLKYLR